MDTQILNLDNKKLKRPSRNQLWFWKTVAITDM